MPLHLRHLLPRHAERIGQLDEELARARVVAFRLRILGKDGNCEKREQQRRALLLLRRQQADERPFRIFFRGRIVLVDGQERLHMLDRQLERRKRDFPQTATAEGVAPVGALGAEQRGYQAAQRKLVLMRQAREQVRGGLARRGRLLRLGRPAGPAAWLRLPLRRGLRSCKTAK